MHCEFCGFANGEDDHRCLRCGRRTTGVVIAAPASFSGNNALALDPWSVAMQSSSVTPEPPAPPADDAQDFPLLRDQDAPPPHRVIPFDQIPRPAARIPAPRQTPPPQFAAPPARPAPQRRKQTPAPPSAQQSTLDFTPVTAAPARTLTNGILAANYCQRPVATIPHRISAAVMDITMILIGFGLFFGGAALTGTALGISDILGTGKPFLILMASFLVIMTAFYGTIWIFARRETAGMRMAGLELITFDNTPLDPLTRIIRVAATCVSIGACGLGVIWAIADEEKLTWQDHISRSFPTFPEGSNTLVKQPRS